MGLTLECCHCHDHKFDPLSQKEYYEVSAFFDNIDEAGLYSYFTSAIPSPSLLLPTDEQRRTQSELRSKLASIEQQLATLPDRRRAEFNRWLRMIRHDTSHRLRHCCTWISKTRQQHRINRWRVSPARRSG